MSSVTPFLYVEVGLDAGRFTKKAKREGFRVHGVGGEWVLRTSLRAFNPPHPKLQ